MLMLLLLALTPNLGPSPGGDDERHREGWGAQRETCEVVDLRALGAANDGDDAHAPDGAGVDERDDHRSHRRRRSFSAATTIDLGFSVTLQRSRHSDSRVELRLYTPKGHLYQKLKLDPPRRAHRSHGGDPEWTGTLPVAGTAIVVHSIYGRWRVEPHLDDRPEPCGAAATLWIQP